MAETSMANMSASIKEFGDTCQRIAERARGLIRVRDPENLALINCREGGARWLEIEPVEVRKIPRTKRVSIIPRPVTYRPDFIVVNGVRYDPA